MHLIYCKLPLNRVHSFCGVASNDSRAITLHPISDEAGNPSNVRLMRRAKDNDSTRFALSGKLVDVCAALDQLAAQETRNAWRRAYQ